MKKRWVIPDIHGCVKTLKALIETQVKPDLGDELFFLGDYIDRGPDSKGVVDYLMQLSDDGYQTTFLLGNHEDYCIKSFDEDRVKKSFLGIVRKTKTQSIWERHGGKETLDSFGVRFAGQIPEKYIEWMRKLRYFVELDQYILVHAGFNFDLEDPLTDQVAMIWTRDFKVQPDKIRHKRVIHGHVPVDLEFMSHIMQSTAYHFIDLDNGVYMDNRAGYGNLVAFELNSKTQLIQNNIDY